MLKRCWASEIIRVLHGDDHAFTERSNEDMMKE